jgi:hypothetical protein
MFKISRNAGLAIALGAALFGVQASQAAMMEFHKTAKSGQATMLGRLWSCKTHVPPAASGSNPEHGSITLKDGQFNQCGNPNEPVKEVWYTSAPGFKGEDSVRYLWGYRGVNGITYHVTVQ